ncbi:MAG: twin-arginine translocase TatA/TatE family subunit [Thermomicrobiales bacterium]
MSVGPPELLLILAIIVIIFGAGKLPEAGGALGRGIREFRDASRPTDVEEDRDGTSPENPSDT